MAYSLAFGGPDFEVIFIASASLSNTLDMAPAGYDPHNTYVGGRLYRTKAEVLGKKEFRSRVRLIPNVSRC